MSECIHKEFRNEQGWSHYELRYITDTLHSALIVYYTLMLHYCIALFSRAVNYCDTRLTQTL